MTRRFAVIPLLFILCVLSPPKPAGAEAEPPTKKNAISGINFYRNYTRKEYDNQSQNWAVVQDKRGIIYAGNQGNIMEFDGVSWKEIEIPNKTARSLAIDENGTVYAGGLNEIGRLETFPTGRAVYISLLDHLEEKYKNFSYVWRVHAAAEGIYFCTSPFIFLLPRDGKQIKTWVAVPGTTFSPPFLCRGQLYTRQNGTGILEMKNGKLEPAPGGQEFAFKKIYMMAEYDARHILIGTQQNGFFLYDGEKTTPFAVDRLAFITGQLLTHGIRLSSGDFALATFHGGLFIIDKTGSVKLVFDTSTGMQDNTVWYVYEDSQGNLWTALNEGITKIEYASPFSMYDDAHSGLPGKVLSVIRHGPQNILFAGTTNGLYYLAETGKFEPLPGITGECRALLSLGGSLLAAASTGVYQIEVTDDIKKSIPRKILPDYSYILYPSPSKPDRVWVGKANGLTSLYHSSETGRWHEEHRFETVTGEIITLAEDAAGDLWLGPLTKGVQKITFPTAGTMTGAQVTVYSTEHGLPDSQVRVFSAAGHIMFATGKGIFRFHAGSSGFIPDLTFGEETAGGEKGSGIFLVREDHRKNVWLHSNARNILALRQPDNSYVLDRTPFLRLPLAQVNDIYPVPGGKITWFAGVDGLIRFDHTDKKDYRVPFHTLIRRVSANGKPLTGAAPVPVIPYKERSLRFEFAAPFFENEAATRYQCFLEGYDEDWTAWSAETWKDYTNIDPGVNTFRVRARNVYGTIGGEASFRFKIPPPWYRTVWAVLLYAAAFFLLMYFVVRRRSIHLQKEKQALEKVIDERTGEINRKNRQLEEMAQVKSRFFANISHEFRTPLTLILGPLEQMLSDASDEKQIKKITLMIRNAQRLLGLIDQLLTLSKFESGNIKLEASPTNIIPIIKGITASFEILADQRELDLTFHADSETLSLYIDRVKIEEVMANLLANAVKFTPAGGKIAVSVTEVRQGGNEFPAGYAEITVRDTGPGIPPGQLPYIFDRFFQSDSTFELHRKGSGIGLAIVRELVELHHGTVSARNREDGVGGTEFCLRFPLGKAHLEAAEIVVRPEPLPGTGMPHGVPVDVTGEEEDVPAGIEAAAIEADRSIILVVEDSADVRRYIREELEPLYMIAEAVNGTDGLDKAMALVPDLIICDVMMPQMDGYELCRRLKSDRTTSHIPVILLTAKASEENILEGLETGADDYMTKPFNSRILAARIKNLIDIRTQLQQDLEREMTLKPVKSSVSGIDREFLKELQTVINKNISDPEFNVEELGRKLYMSGATLYRKIRALSGESPTDFIRSCRLKRAAQLLKNRSVSVSEVAFEVGFTSRAYFTKCFKEKFHQLPSNFSETGG